MVAIQETDVWTQFIDVMKERSSPIEFDNWFAAIRLIQISETEVTVEVPNVFVQEYLLSNYKKEMNSFLMPRTLQFVIAQKKEARPPPPPTAPIQDDAPAPRLNTTYTFECFIEGPSNQFAKSAALGVALRPGRAYNPLFLHGGVGLGKTHLLHAIGHHVHQHHKKLRVHCLTAENFVSDLIENLKKKSLDQMKRFYRSLDVLLIDDIQFLQDRPNFEEEFCNTFETLIHQNKQIVITSDKSPTHLKLSERLVARMEWGLVAQVSAPELETRVAILQHKAEQRGFRMPEKIAFSIAEHLFSNVRQLEGAVNRLSAYCRLMGLEVTEEIVEKALAELFQPTPTKRPSIEKVLKSVAAVFEVKVSEICSRSRTKKVAFARQVAMYLAREFLSESVVKLASAFGGKTHSTLLHAWKKVGKRIESDETLRRQIQIARRELGS